MASTIGLGLNQVPTNGMLGGMAFQNTDFTTVDRLSVTAIDVNKYVSEKSYQVTFPTGTAHQKVQIYWPTGFRLQGGVEITVLSSYNYAQASGMIRKCYGLHVAENGVNYLQTTRIPYSLGSTPSWFTISDFQWDSVNKRWYVVIANLAGTTTGSAVNSGNTVGIHVKTYLGNHWSFGMAASQTNISEIYTTDTTVFPQCFHNYPNNLLVGSSSPRSNLFGASYAPALQIETASATGTGIASINNTNDANPPAFYFVKTRGTAVGANTAVIANDVLGSIDFLGANGSDLSNCGGRIRCEVDGTPFSSGDTTDLPGRLTFSTTADGAASPTERMRIAADGTVGIGQASDNINYRLNIYNPTADTCAVSIGNTTSGGGSLNGLIIVQNQADSQFVNRENGYMSFYTNNGEKLRITSTGTLLVNSLSTNFTNEGNQITRSQAPNSTSVAWADQVSALGVYGNFGGGSNNQQCSSALTVYGWSSNGVGGAIMRGWWSSVQASLSTPTLVYQVAAGGNVTNANNSYGALSDERLKQDISDAGSQWEDLKNLRIRKFRFIREVEKETIENPAPYLLGCVAQEVMEVSPGLVETLGDDKDAEGNEIKDVQTLKYSVLYMKAIKALQEAMERIETLEAKVSSLEG